MSLPMVGRSRGPLGRPTTLSGLDSPAQLRRSRCWAWSLASWISPTASRWDPSLNPIAHDDLGLLARLPFRKERGPDPPPKWRGLA